MEEKGGFYVDSEVKKLKRVMLHRPGKELERLTIENKEELLFDDLIWLDEAQKEHDAFAELLLDNGVEVVYFNDCLAFILKEKDLRSEILNDVLSMEAIDYPLFDFLKSELMEIDSARLSDILISGLTKKEVKEMAGKNSILRSLVFEAMEDTDFLIKPLPNLYFQRDPFIFVKDGVIISVMKKFARRREPLYARYIFKYHPYFEGVTIWFGEDEYDTYPYTIEGGDVLVLSSDTLAIGISERTSAGALQIVGRRLAMRAGIKRIIAVEIPQRRAYMHLDTVFTMVDFDAFIMYPGVEQELKLWELVYDEGGNLLSISEWNSLKECLKSVLNLDRIRCIETGGGDPVIAAREQWNDGTNTLAVAPGVVVTYRRNRVSNQVLRENGIKVFEIKGNELVRGRGGPRCMSMPLLRE